jgi:hypothetical protein
VVETGGAAEESAVGRESGYANSALSEELRKIIVPAA